MTAAEGELRDVFGPHRPQWGGGTEWFMDNGDMEDFEGWVITQVNEVN